jgi:putative pyruvate formate lyase activating enzyme
MTTRDLPAYRQLYNNGELARRADKAMQSLQCCDLCARYCYVNRIQSIKGAVCHTGERAIVYSFGPHHGEENPLRGRRGSGTIFFSWCNLRCQYCQNWEISQKGQGREVTAQELADMMMNLQAQGCHNINFVSPSHVVAQIIGAVNIAAAQGLHLPLVYNTGGYDSLEALALLDGIIDIYMPDMKYGDADLAHRYSHVRDYVAINRLAVKAMHRQVGDLVLDNDGLAVRGLLVRHLVLPNHIAGTDSVLAFIAREISTNTYINIMDQYYPCYRADEYPKLARRIDPSEYSEALQLTRDYSLYRLDGYNVFAR